MSPQELDALAATAARESLLAYAIGMIPTYECPPHLELLASKLEAVARGEIKRLMVFMPPRHGKQVADSTPVLTTAGWKTHGELAVGDEVFGPDGRPAKVLALSGKTPSDVRVTLSDGSSVLCHENHEWTVFDRSTRGWRTVETGYWLEQTKFGRRRQIVSAGRSIYQLPEVGAIQMPQADLPVPPYVLGAWLGDGSSTKPCLTHAQDDSEVAMAIEEAGYGVTAVCRHKATGVLTTYFKGKGGLTDGLRALGVMPEKHIPRAYKLSSVQQRLELLAGLIDTDGHVERATGRVRIVTALPRLRDDVFEVATSLGFRPYVTSQEPAVSTSGVVGRKTIYTVGFQPTMDLPTRLPRKRITRLAPQRRLGVVAVERVEGSTEVGSCIQVDRADGLYLVGRSLIPTHNSNLSSEIFPAWYLGHKPKHQVMFTTYGQDLADGFGRKVRNAVGDPRHVRAFAESILSEDSKSAQRFNTTAGGVYYAVGAGGAVTGRGADLLLIDDPLKNREEADSRLMRDKLWDWYASTAYTRLMPGGAVVLIQTRWHEDDLAGRLLNGEEQWEVVNLPAIAEPGDALGRREGEALWPARYDAQALERIRTTIGEREFTALYQQRPSPLDGALFRRDWIQRRKAPGSGVRIAMGVDLALSTKTSADYTAIVVMARDEFGKLYVLDAVRERVDFPGALRLIRLVADKWNPKAIAIEQVAYQAVVVQELLRSTTLPIKGVTPDRDKVTRAQPLALRYEQGLVFHEQLPSWFEDELLAFPQGVHDDAVDAAVYAYQAVMSMRGSDSGVGRVEVFDPFDPEMGT